MTLLQCMKILIDHGYEYFKLLPMNPSAPGNWFELSREVANLEKASASPEGFSVIDNKVVQSKQLRDKTRWLRLNEESDIHSTLNIESCYTPDLLPYTSLHIECRRPLR